MRSGKGNPSMSLSRPAVYRFSTVGKPYLQLLQQRAQSSLNKQFLRPLRAGLSRDLGSEERDIVGLSVGITVQTNDKASTSVASAAKNPPATSSGRGARELALRQAQLYIFGQPDHTFEPFPSIQQPQQPQQVK